MTASAVVDERAAQAVLIKAVELANSSERCALLGGMLGSLIGLHAAIWFATAGLFLAALPYALSSAGRLVGLPEPTPEMQTSGAPA